jgi:dGTPase
MPDEFSDRASNMDETHRARVVADYIAGMTDRFAISEHKRITG